MATGADEQAQSVAQTRSVVNDLAGSIDRISSGSDQQVTSISNQVAGAVSEMAEAAQRAAAGAEQASGAAEAGANKVDETIEGMAKISNAVDVAAA
jgi:methyl-accepting chemotaxis protein